MSLIYTETRPLSREIEIVDSTYGGLHRVGEHFCQILREAEARLGRRNSILRISDQLVKSCEGSKHIDRIQRYLKIFIDALATRNIFPEISEWEQNHILLASRFHDIGMVVINKRINRIGRTFSNAEYSSVKPHPLYGEAIIDEIAKQIGGSRLLTYAKTFAGTHHEKWDGSGYPRGLVGEAIPLPGRIMAIVDSYDALVTERTYKSPLCLPIAERTVTTGAGKNFDPLLIDVFKTVTRQFAQIAATL
jgi:putative two-component system response regulator